MTPRHCHFIKPGGQPCQASPMAGAPYCFWHAPDRSADVAEAGRLGGLRRKREKTVADTYAFEGIASVPDIRRVVEVAIVDTLALDNTVGRNRTLAYLCMVAIKLLETGELEERVATLEGAIHGQAALAAPVFDLEVTDDALLSFVPQEDLA